MELSNKTQLNHRSVYIFDSCRGRQSHFAQRLLHLTTPRYNNPLREISLSQRRLQSIAINGYVGVHSGDILEDLVRFTGILTECPYE